MSLTGMYFDTATSLAGDEAAVFIVERMEESDDLMISSREACDDMVLIDVVIAASVLMICRAKRGGAWSVSQFWTEFTLRIVTPFFTSGITNPVSSVQNHPDHGTCSSK
jgi:hypothetical protein